MKKITIYILSLLLLLSLATAVTTRLGMTNGIFYWWVNTTDSLIYGANISCHNVSGATYDVCAGDGGGVGASGNALSPINTSQLQNTTGILGLNLSYMSSWSISGSDTWAGNQTNYWNWTQIRDYIQNNASWLMNMINGNTTAIELLIAGNKTVSDNDLTQNITNVFTLMAANDSTLQKNLTDIYLNITNLHLTLTNNGTALELLIGGNKTVSDNDLNQNITVLQRNLTDIYGNITDINANRSLWNNPNSTGLLTNYSRIKLNCTMIDGAGNDTNFCTDATGAGGAFTNGTDINVTNINVTGNITGNNYCNSTACYILSDLLRDTTGSGADYTKIQNATTNNCTGNNRAIGLFINGTVICNATTSGTGGGHTGIGVLYNDTTSMYFNWTLFNDTQGNWSGDRILYYSIEDIQANYMTAVDIDSDFYDNGEIDNIVSIIYANISNNATRGAFTNISNFTNEIVNGGWCWYVNGEINCTLTPPVYQALNGKWCKGYNVESDDYGLAPYLAINCEYDLPASTTGYPLLNNSDLVNDTGYMHINYSNGLFNFTGWNAVMLSWNANLSRWNNATDNAGTGGGGGYPLLNYTSIRNDTGYISFNDSYRVSNASFASNTSYATYCFYSYNSSFTANASYSTNAYFATNSSYARNASWTLNASFATNSYFSWNSSYASNAYFATNASYSRNASWTLNASFATNAYYSWNASYCSNLANGTIVNNDYKWDNANYSAIMNKTCLVNVSNTGSINGTSFTIVTGRATWNSSGINMTGGNITNAGSLQTISGVKINSGINMSGYNVSNVGLLQTVSGIRINSELNMSGRRVTNAKNYSTENGGSFNGTCLVFSTGFKIGSGC